MSKPDFNSKVFQSSQLLQGRYDPVTSTLTLWFANGNIYKYSSVPPQVWSTLRSAVSPGSYFHVYIKPIFRNRQVAVDADTVDKGEDRPNASD